MGRKQKSKTPQPQKGPRAQVQGMQKPQSAPGPNKHGKKAGNQTPMKPGGKLFQNGGNTPAQTKATPKAGDKRKLDSSLVASQPAKKPNTPLIVSAKGKNTPAKSPKIPPQLMKTPGGKKTPQAKTPAFAAKAKKTPQKPASDDDEDDDDDDDDEDIDFDNIVFGSGSDDDEEDDESLEEDMDDDDDDEEEESEQSLKKAIDASVKRGVKTANKMDESDDDDDDEDDDVDIAAMAGGASSDDDEVDDDDDDDDDEDEDDDDRDVDIDEDAVLKSIQNQQKAADKSSQKQQKQPEASKQKQKAETKPPQQKKAEQSKQAAGGKQKGQEKPQPSAQAANKKQEKKGEKKGKVADASGDAQRKEDRDKRTLFVKNLGPDTTTKDIKNLSKDIVDVRLRITIRGKGKERKKLGYAFVEFGSEAQADKNFKVLEGAKVKGNNLVVDFVGQKSSFLAKNPKKEAADPDPLRLYITGFGTGTKEQDLYKLFPKAQDITLPVRKRDNLPIGYAFLVFATEEQCKAAHDKGQGAKVNGQGLVVLYAKKRTQNQLKKDKKRAEKSKAPKNEKKKDKDQPPAKKAKVELKQEEGDDDDDDDDEDEDSDDEGAAGAAVFGSSEDDDEDEDDDDDDDDEEDDDDDDDDESE